MRFPSLAASDRCESPQTAGAVGNMPRYGGLRRSGSRDAMFRLPPPGKDRLLAATGSRRELEIRSRTPPCPASTACGVYINLVLPATARGFPSLQEGERAVPTEGRSPS
jgi:hypothetical protein